MALYLNAEFHIVSDVDFIWDFEGIWVIHVLVSFLVQIIVFMALQQLPGTICQSSLDHNLNVLTHCLHSTDN